MVATVPCTRMNRVFLSRLLSTLVLWAVVLTGILTGNEIVLAGCIGALGLVALLEFYRMLGVRGITHFPLIGVLCGAALFAGSFFAARCGGVEALQGWESTMIAFTLLALAIRQIAACRGRTPEFAGLAFTFFGLVYVVVLFNYMNKLVYLTPRTEAMLVTGQYAILFLMVVTKFSDMGAYLVGSLIGRHPMAPSISPNKTWQGFGGALLFSTLGSVVMFLLLGERLAFLGWGHAIVLGLLLGLAAIAGDLLESIIKRDTGVKDSGRFLPGIGGALDLIDSLLFTAPLLYFYLKWFVLIPVN